MICFVGLLLSLAMSVTIVTATKEATEVNIGTRVCLADKRPCQDGSHVGRDVSNNCAWHPCPTIPPPLVSGNCFGGRPSHKTRHCLASIITTPDPVTAISNNCPHSYNCLGDGRCCSRTGSAVDGCLGSKYVHPTIRCNPRRRRDIVTLGCPAGYKCMGDGHCCPGKRFVVLEEIIRFEDHLRVDILRFLELHMKLVRVVPNLPGSSKMRIPLDQIWADIMCINDLLCEIKETKRKLDNLSDKQVVTASWSWIKQIMKKASWIKKAVSKLRKKMKKSNQVILLNEMLDLQMTCLTASIKIPLRMNLDLGHDIMLILIPLTADKSHPLCQKAEEMGLLYHKLLYDLLKVHENTSAKFIQYGNPGLLPTEWFEQMAECVGEFADLYYIMRNCCEFREQIPPMDLVKKIGNWLTRAMALREQMRKCFPANPGNAIESALSKIDSSAAVQNMAKECGDNIDERYKGVLKRFDDCLIKIRCLYVEYTAEVWRQLGAA